MDSTKPKYDPSEIREYLRKGNRMNRYINYGPIHVCVRVGYHMIHGRPMWTFDIVNVSIQEEYLRGKGTFKAMIQDIEQILGEDEHGIWQIEGIYVENVMPSALRIGLLRMGFELVKTSDQSHTFTPSFYSPLPMPFGRLARE